MVGGLTPLVAVWLVERTADELAPAYLIMVAAAVSFLGACRMKETLRTSLPDCLKRDEGRIVERSAHGIRAASSF